jgi:antitoxin (DNA-binding transcriptional repressor) of toxin-antitoxin stability system
MPLGDGDRILGYTMRDLRLRTDQVIDEIQKHQLPAYVTKHGRFIAVIIPFEPAEVEAAVGAAIAQEVGSQEGPSAAVSDGGALVCTVHDLNQRTDQLLEQIRKHQRAMYITSRGRFIAQVTSLEPGEVESAVLTEMAQELG